MNENQLKSFLLAADEKSFSKAQTDICKYEFSEGEAAKILHTQDTTKNE